MHVVTDPSNEQIKATLLKTWPFGSGDPKNHPYFKKWTQPSYEYGNKDTPIINEWLDILGDDLAKRAINFFKFDRIPLPWGGELTEKHSTLLE
ncbi:MAG: hypothetical protein ISQ13_04375 [Candidatus Margulisbacteria bacterium]|nr:hypothetical protein [Candidatus Margulisiibacteriota bacterium]